MNKKDVKIARDKILKYLTEDTECSVDERTGKPLKERKRISGIFDEFGKPIYYETNLDMIMDRVMLGLYMASENSDRVYFSRDDSAITTRSLHKLRKMIQPGKAVKLCYKESYKTDEIRYIISINTIYDKTILYRVWQPESKSWRRFTESTSSFLKWSTKGILKPHKVKETKNDS